MSYQKNRKIKNVVLISLDCVRREALGCYPQRFPQRVRFPRFERTPTIDYLGNHGHRFTQTITPAPFTPAAHASLFTGLIPPDHGLRTMFGSRLNDNALTIAERFSSDGWRCGAIIGAGALDHEFGLDKGFEYYDDDIQTGETNWLLGERRDAFDVTDRAINWLKSVNNHNFFLFVHYFDAHTIHEFDPKTLLKSGSDIELNERSRSSPVLIKTHTLIKKIRSVTIDYFEIGLPFFVYSKYGRRYMIRQTRKIDNQIGRLLHFLEECGHLDDTLIVILADHGEDFWEHGELDHRIFLYDTTLRIPLIIYPKLGNQSVIKYQTSIIDIFPSIISLLGLDPLNIDIQGSSIGCLLNHGNKKINFTKRSVYSETIWETPPPGKIELHSVYAALRIPPWKLIWNRLDDTYELYNLDNDPRELLNLSDINKQIVTKLSTQLKSLAQEMPIRTDNEANEMVYNRLKALGYM